MKQYIEYMRGYKMKTLMVILVSIFFVTACNNEKVATANSVEDQAKKIMVEVKELSPQPFSHYFSANGELEAVKDAFISPELGGQVKEIHVSEGDRVKRGQLLVTLNGSVIRMGISWMAALTTC